MESTLELIEKSLKHTFEKYSIDKFRQQIDSVYCLMRLRNNSRWFNNALSGLDHSLLLEEKDQSKLKLFVEKIIEGNEQNSYLMNFVKESSKKHFETINQKLNKEGTDVFFEAIVYGWILENVTNFLAENPHVLTLIRNHWVEERGKVNSLPKGIKLFFRIKLVSVEGPVDRMIQFHSTGKVRESFLRIMLPLNIYEASFTDLIQGKAHNAIAGLILAFFRPGRGLFGRNEVAKWTEDGKKIEISYSEQVAWNDLYQTWNMDFVTRYSYYPLILQKLLIPCTSSHREHPKLYCFYRCLALYTHLNFVFFNYLQNEEKGTENWDWLDKKLTKEWGKSNLRSALDYLKKALKL